MRCAYSGHSIRLTFAWRTSAESNGGGGNRIPGPLQKTPEKSMVSEEGGAISGMPQGLAAVIVAWPTLPEAIRAEINRVVRLASRPQQYRLPVAQNCPSEGEGAS